MTPVSRAAQVRELDRRVISDLGVPGAALMEVAARGVAKAIARWHAEHARQGTVVVCGPGNNGGDGYAIARWLDLLGFPVAIWPVGKAPRAGTDAAIMAEAAVRLQLPLVDTLGEAFLIVDAIFGTGVDRPVTGAAAAAIQAINDHPAPVVSVDLPSGLHSDTGAVLGVCVDADHTVVIGRHKAGLFCGSGPDLAGHTSLVDIGLDALSTHADADAEIPDPSDLRWPARDAGAHKNRSGHLLVVAGSAAMAGAAILACRGALAAGAGLVTLLAPEGARTRLEGLPPEVMVQYAGPGDTLTEIPTSALKGRSAVAAGPGLGGGAPLGDAMIASLRALWSANVPAVFDADALGALAPPGVARAVAARVITPHPGEAARLLSARAATEASAVEADRFGAIERLTSVVPGATVLLKGRYTLIRSAERRTSINPTNSAVLATGGSGDVLTGVLGALLARGTGAHDAARLGAWVHGRAGQRLEANRRAGWTASDVAATVPDAIVELDARASEGRA